MQQYHQHKTIQVYMVNWHKAAFQYRSVIKMRTPMPTMTRMMATAAAAAATTGNTAPNQLYFTYRLGQSIYVPLTCRCNSRTLPQLRGESFTLPVSIVAALCRVRDVEMLGNNSQQEQQQAWWWDDDNDDFLNKRQEDGVSQKLELPPSQLETVATLPVLLPPDYDQQQREPTIDDLCQEIQQQLLQEQQQQSRDGDDKNDTTTKTGKRIDSIVLSGEGEPTLRFDDMIELVRRLKSFTTKTLPLTSSSQQQQQPVTIRLTTNGLVTAATTTNNSNSNISIPQRLKDCGISQVSVGLMTWDAKQYNDLVRPVLIPRTTKNNNNLDNKDDPKKYDNDDTTTVDAFDILCKFIKDAVQVHGLDVETTAVDRPDVDKVKTEIFASKILGVSNQVRWRPYFP
jgi:hypothetical protein